MKLKLSELFLTMLLGIALAQGCDSSNPAQPDPSPEETLTDEELMDLVQEKTFNYFWDGAEPNSGLALERSNGSGTTVTMGGSGFGLASFPAAVERGWITRPEAIARLEKALSFLEKVPTYHGAFSHWYNGATAETQPFSDLDNGGDLVETAFLMQGLLINRQYFDGSAKSEQEIRDRITALWEAVEWTWYQQKDENVLTWHWSPDHDFEIDLPVTGWNEALMVYVLAASSPTYAIEPEVYHQGWAQNGSIKNGNTYYNEQLPWGQNWAGRSFLRTTPLLVSTPGD